MNTEQDKTIKFIFWSLAILGSVSLITAVAYAFGVQVAVWSFTGLAIILAVFLMLVN